MGGLQPLAGIAAMLAMLPAALLPLWRPRPRRDAPWVLLLALALAGPAVQALLLTGGHWQPGLPAALWITVAAVMLLFAGAALMTREAWRLLPLLMPWLLLLGLLAVLWERSGAGEGAVADSGAWVVLHILVSVATYALLTLAAVAGLAVILQERALKARKRPTRLTHSLPSVADCEALQIRLLTASAAVLAIGVLTGMASGWVVRGSLLSFDHKTLLVLAGLVVICLLLWAHHRTGLRGRRAARIVLLAWGLLTLGWLGVKFVTDVLIG